MTEQILFNGLMDLDTTNEVFQKGFHKNARNIRFKGVPGNLRPENINGTRQVSYSLPAGTNECIGSYYDADKRRVIWFNCNSTNKHGIYQMIDGTITPVVVCSTTDFLGFTQQPIHSVNIIYTDFGDILYFIDSLKRPTKINIDRAIANGYGTMQRSFLDAAKEPPPLPPLAVYSDDGTATINNLRKSLFQFRAVWEFDDKERSVYSSMSEVPLAPNFLDTNNDADPTKNSKISVTVQTGAANVKKIHVIARQSESTTWSNQFLVITLDKAALSIANNTTYTYDFKNNAAADYVEVKETTLLFDYIPREANTQELLNGNIVIYGGIKEGFPLNITPNVSLTVSDIVDSSNANTIASSYNWWSKYKLGLIYYDDKEQTNGVITNASFEFTTLTYNETGGVRIPQISASISHRPPLWATKYQWARTGNLSYSSFLNWVTEVTYKDADYAYLSIQNLFTQKDDNDKTILTYDFTPGDRVRFIKQIGGSVLSNKDYEIYSLANEPVVSGTQRQGIFLKIKLPTTGGGFDFGTGFNSYLINIYTPAKLVENGLNTYYEFGEAYLIGNPGLSTAYHKGKTQDQSSDLITPALFKFTKGDVYLKTRTVPIGGETKWDVGIGWITAGQHTVSATVTTNNLSNQTYLTGNSPLAALSGFSESSDDSRWVIKTTTDAYTFRAQGDIKLNTSEAQFFKLILRLNDMSEIELISHQNLTSGDYSFSFDKTFTIPAGKRVFLITVKDEGPWLGYTLGGSIKITNAATQTVKVQDRNFSDTFLSAVNSNGRPVVEDTQGEVYNPTLVRYGQQYESGTNINRTNRFYPANFDEYDRARGDIKRLGVKGSELFVFQTTGVGTVGVFQEFLHNADGSGNLLQSDKIINRIRYMQGGFGLSHPTALAKSSGAFYFSDTKGYQVRVATDGLTPISEKYRAQYYLPPILKNYSKGYTTSSGSPSKILGVYDFRNEEFVSVFQRCQQGSTLIYAGDTLGFNETRNGYCSFYDIQPESIVWSEDGLVVFKNGAIYVCDSTQYNTFFGTNFPSFADVVINEGSNVKKEFTSIGFTGSSAWASPVITTSMGQSSNFVASDYEQRESVFTAAFGRDINSIGGWAEGDFLKGIYCLIRLQTSSTTLEYLHGLYVNTLISTKKF